MGEGHTPEPWRVEERGPEPRTVYVEGVRPKKSGDGRRFIVQLLLPELEDIANARRIVACVNACVGTELLEGLSEPLEVTQ